MCPQLRLFVLESDGALTKEWVDRVTGGAWDVAQVEMERERVGGVGGEGWRDGGMEGWRDGGVCVCVCVEGIVSTVHYGTHTQTSTSTPIPIT